MTGSPAHERREGHAAVGPCHALTQASSRRGHLGAGPAELAERVEQAVHGGTGAPVWALAGPEGAGQAREHEMIDSQE